MLVMNDATDKGHEAIFKQHYAGNSKPRLISLYTTLTTLQKRSGEMLTDYIIQAETVVNALKNTKEIVSDGLLMGLPSDYSPFIVVTTRADKKTLTFTKFKQSLRNFGENESTIINKDKPFSVMKGQHVQHTRR